MDLFVSRVRAENGRCFDPTGFVGLLGRQADGGKHIVEQDADRAVKELSVQAVFGCGADADDDDFGRTRFGLQAREVV